MSTRSKLLVCSLGAAFVGAVIYGGVCLEIEPRWICLGVVLFTLGAILISKFPVLLIAGLVFVGLYKTEAANGAISVTDPTLLLVLLTSAAMGWELLLIVGGIRQTSLRQVFRGQARGVLAYVVLLGVVALSYLYTPVRAFGTDKLIQFVAFNTLTFFAPFVLIKDERDFRRLTFSLVVLAIPLAIKLLIGIAHATSLELLGQEDVTQIGTAEVIDIAILILLYYRTKWRFRSVYMFAVLPLFAIASVASIARGPNLMLVLVVVLSTFLLPSQSALSRVTVIISVLVLFVGMAISVMWVKQLPGAQLRGPEKAAELSALAHGTLDAGGTISSRLSYYKSTLKAFSDHPLTGVGLAAWPTYYGDTTVLYPHNFVLEVAAEQGSLGLLALFGLLGAALTGLMQVRRSGSEFVFILPVFLFVCLFNLVSSGIVNRTTFFCIGWAFVANRMLPSQETAGVLSNDFRQPEEFHASVAQR